MKCPFCGYKKTRTVNSRTLLDNAVRRRRQCPKCRLRFTTFELFNDDLRPGWVSTRRDGSHIVHGPSRGARRDAP